jgi:corrinoid protein of di/trimethylamine methyltransferase
MESQILEELGRTVTEFNVDGAEDVAKKAMEAGIDPLKAMDALTAAIQVIGDAFGRGETFLPELIGAAQALEKALPIIEAEILKKGAVQQSLGMVVIGSVAGDIHNIGKSMVSSLLIAGGFSVRDLGINVPTEKFVETVREYKPAILAMSALLTTTAPEGGKVIEALKEAGLRDKVKVMIGGGAITAEFAGTIGADGYDATAPGAVDLAHKLVGK